MTECVSDVCYCGSRPRLPKPHDVAIHALDDGAERSFQLTWSYARDPDALVSPYLFNVRQDPVILSVTEIRYRDLLSKPVATHRNRRPSPAIHVQASSVWLMKSFQLESHRAILPDCHNLVYYETR